ncbi:DUF1783-domain-containing protein [Cylindrobasidium torrendii FP15055 ss-10]|uniref:DUF1783-domain-containing protein n=1 Tax=Cylindrobasidium torrendii FP15055 ss-10 TaxID=1314674 RepID=A0A0D7B7E7_9AGAR|nr:DUF1783-domain-containing protein [Cylindrobasidium torrendii FP15055 ss-10]
MNTLIRRVAFAPIARPRTLCAYSTYVRKPPPPPTEPPTVTMYTDTSRPRPFKRDLPRMRRKWPAVLAFGALGLSAWVAFYTFATNQGKITSSVVQQSLRTVKHDPGAQEVIGEAIRFEPEWWLNGDPWILGSVNMLQGHVDLSFRVKGTKGAGTVYFTSIRRDKGMSFEIVRFKLIADNGTVVQIDPATA